MKSGRNLLVGFRPICQTWGWQIQPLDLGDIASLPGFPVPLSDCRKQAVIYFLPGVGPLRTSVPLKYRVSKTKLLTCNYYRRILIRDSAFTVATKNLEFFLGNILSGTPI